MGLKTKAVATSILAIICAMTVLLIFARVPGVISKQDLPAATPWSFAWEVGREDVPLDGQLTIRTKGSWELALMFQPNDTGWDAMSAFLGDGSYRFVTDTSPEARKLIPQKDGTLNELNVRANNGEIIRRRAKPGTTVRIKVSVEEAQGGKKMLLSRTVDTTGVDYYIAGAQLRVVAGVLLEPGVYRVQAAVSQPLTLPAGVRMSLAAVPPRRY